MGFVGKNAESCAKQLNLPLTKGLLESDLMSIFQQVGDLPGGNQKC
jgi:hypothetical protein